MHAHAVYHFAGRFETNFPRGLSDKAERLENPHTQAPRCAVFQMHNPASYALCYQPPLTTRSTRRNYHTQTDIVVAVIRRIIVTIGGATIVTIVDPRAVASWVRENQATDARCTAPNELLKAPLEND